ncbi:hypothetical protein [Listeria fleischmannii]|jgi:hypothetical protein|uniref:Uncharacterized protein n=1 Tax=Listeria fleischmannii TaxID=1069827 RepID=A0A841YEJ0_9LIST|nr:hypothetical protein [Listeria fleischmannii]EIA19200.1 hypothetical protein KKC_13685 [Listeria fleischmannii subsp. coloradonensis]MBC1398686.1 hypothetical protein [Listeria fleischmannii]MBC1418197.1 hypothetical protein [Listeria fleischmannii]MBC1426970.1 hypothetical protein [Listeria fleischmannii]STY35970.1 Uncharacterised protein [Listeria fleischmannii subsp. coloradonensis]
MAKQDNQLLDIAKDLTVAWVQKFGDGEINYPDQNHVGDAFKDIYKAVKEAAAE